MPRSYSSVRLAGLTALVTALALISGCKTAPTLQPPEPELQLLRSAPLTLPPACEASGSFFVSFTVSTTGTTRDIRAADAPPCVQEALTAWVESFEYAPPARATPAAVEWMMVSAKRGS